MIFENFVRQPVLVDCVGAPFALSDLSRQNYLGYNLLSPLYSSTTQHTITLCVDARQHTYTHTHSLPLDFSQRGSWTDPAQVRHPTLPMSKKTKRMWCSISPNKKIYYHTQTLFYYTIIARVNRNRALSSEFRLQSCRLFVLFGEIYNMSLHIHVYFLSL